MTSRFVRAGAALVLTVLIGGAAMADVTDVQKGVYATLLFDSGATLSLQARNVSNNANADTVTFGPISAGQSYTLANQYVQISYTSNFNNYRIVTYTDNGYHDSVTFWGALIGNDTSHKAPIKWWVADDTPGFLAFNSSTADTYTWYKDKGDSDYVTAANSGYTTITYGAGGGYNNLANGTPASSPIVEYIGALTAGIAPDAYHTTLRFDLLHF